MHTVIKRVRTHDVRFPTSRSGAGSDAMNPDPDYSAAYVVLETDRDDLEGHSLVFTIGRGTEVVVAAIQSLSHHVVGQTMEAISADMASFWRALVHDTHLRWLGPEKGVVHMAAGALINALWDLWAKREGKPVWKLLADMTPEELVSCIDFRYIEDDLDREAALAILRRNFDTRPQREAEMLRRGLPAYTTSAGWLGYPPEAVGELARAAVAEGFTHVKLKVGGDIESDLKRARLVREAIGADRRLMVDANQAWGVAEAISAMSQLAEADPWWIEEPTSPDDIQGHAQIRQAVAPIKVATGEHVQNRIMFKQFLQAGAIDILQVDACRVAGLNEVLSILLLAAKHGVPVCPHAGGVGLCEYVQHIAIFDYIAVGASLEDRVCEYVDHLHEHFLDPCVVTDGHYRVPKAAGYSIQMRPESLAEYAFPDGPIWTAAAGT